MLIEGGGVGVLFVPKDMTWVLCLKLQLILDVTGLLARLGDVGWPFRFHSGYTLGREKTFGHNGDHIRTKLGFDFGSQR